MSKSARELRDWEDLYGFDDSHTVTWRSVTQIKAEDKEEGRPNYLATIFVAAAIVIVLIAASQMQFGGPAPAAKTVSTQPEAGAQSSGQPGWGLLGRLVQSKSTATLREDFRSGLSNWDGMRSSDWVSEKGEVRPSSLRIWKASTSMSNYQMEFMGRIERKSMDWAFRASDPKNYYATKLIIAKPGPLPNAGLVRFVVLDGRERERMEFPLPLTLERGVDYRVRVNVQGSRFLTSVNGQLVSSWTDNRLSRGGVGFFSDDGESALVKWVSISERDSFLARIVSQFSLITFPTAAIAAMP